MGGGCRDTNTWPLAKWTAIANQGGLRPGRPSTEVNPGEQHLQGEVS